MYDNAYNIMINLDYYKNYKLSFFIPTGYLSKEFKLKILKKII